MTTSKKIRSGAGGSLKKGSAAQRHGWRKKRAEETRKTNGASNKAGPQQARKLTELSQGAQQQLPGVEKRSDGEKITTRTRKGDREALHLRGSFAARRRGGRATETESEGAKEKGDVDRARRPRGAAL
jgi:ribosomal protein L35